MESGTPQSLEIRIPNASRYRDIAFRIQLNSGALPSLSPKSVADPTVQLSPVSSTASNEINLADPGRVERLTPVERQAPQRAKQYAVKKTSSYTPRRNNTSRYCQYRKKMYNEYMKAHRLVALRALYDQENS